VAKASEVVCTYLKWLVRLTANFWGPSTEEICDCFAIIGLKDNLGYLLVVCHVCKFGHYRRHVGIKVAETDFQRERGGVSLHI